MCKKDIYQEITNQIILDLEKGLSIWEKPWEKGFMGFPVNAFSKSFYSGVNTLILWLRQSQNRLQTQIPLAIFVKVLIIYRKHFSNDNTD